MDFKDLLNEQAKQELGLVGKCPPSTPTGVSAGDADRLALVLDKYSRLVEGYSSELKKSEYQRSLVPPFNWLPSDEAMRLLGISRRTFFNWRDEGIIRVSTVKGKLYCKRSDLEKLLADRYKKGATENC